MHKKHVVFIVPDGVGIKNYLYSKLLKHVNEYAKITIWSPLPKAAFNEVNELHNFSIEYKKLNLHTEPKFTRLFREAATFARLAYYTEKTSNKTIIKNWRKPKHGFKLRLLYALAERIGHWAKSDYARILKLEELSKKQWPTKILNHYIKELSLLKTDRVFITHQRVAGLMPVCLATKSLNIKSFTAIFSWDNLPKARLNVTTDYYLLWSDCMKQDMKLFYPELQPDQLKVVGTPQFEFYQQTERIEDRVKFAEKHKLEPNKKWICFSGDDEYTSPYDPMYLFDIAKEISKTELPIQLIFRRCPVDFSERYDEVLKKHNDIIVPIDPIWHTDSKAWVGYFSKLDDVDLQVNLAYHCEGVINLGSTMALDFASFNKPCLYLNYDTVKDINWSTEYIYNYHHFGSMENLEAVGWINSKAEIVEKINLLLNKKDEVGRDRKKWLKKIVLSPLENNAKIISNNLR